jgi:hypothetical protein
MAYTGWIDVSKGGSPTTLHRDNYPDYVALTLKERTELRAEIVLKFKTLTAFCEANPYVNLPQLVKLFAGGSRIKPSNLRRIRQALENASV